MEWERRWREMVLAGGAMAVAACGSSGSSPNEAEAGCCNANGDPCCYLACASGGYYPDAAVPLSCEQSRMACESDGGQYGYGTDGGLACALVVDGGPEAAPPDAGDGGD